MNLYMIQFDVQPYYVEAPSFREAIEAWRRHVAVLWGTDYEGTEEPESVALINDAPVIREDTVRELLEEMVLLINTEDNVVAGCHCTDTGTGAPLICVWCRARCALAEAAQSIK